VSAWAVYETVIVPLRVGDRGFGGAEADRVDVSARAHCEDGDEAEVAFDDDVREHDICLDCNAVQRAAPEKQQEKSAAHAFTSCRAADLRQQERAATMQNGRLILGIRLRESQTCFRNSSKTSS
jgi:hypothetical protein